MSKNSPVIIFGTGGSGTRIVAKIVRSAGYDLGKNVNPSGDALDISFFLNRQANKYIVQSKWLGVIENFCYPTINKTIIEDFNNTILKYKQNIISEKWGWKSPRSIYMLPFFHEQFPDMLAIHVIRNGLDMAYSDNQNQLKIHGPFILNDSQLGKSKPIQSMTLWSTVNLAALRYGETHFKKNYLCVRFEDICQKPNVTVGEIFRFLDIPVSYEVIPSILKPKTIGRWTKEDQSETKELIAIGEEGLRKFKYLTRYIPKSI